MAMYNCRSSMRQRLAPSTIWIHTAVSCKPCVSQVVLDISHCSIAKKKKKTEKKPSLFTRSHALSMHFCSLSVYPHSSHYVGFLKYFLRLKAKPIYIKLQLFFFVNCGGRSTPLRLKHSLTILIILIWGKMSWVGIANSRLTTSARMALEDW